MSGRDFLNKCVEAESDPIVIGIMIGGAIAILGFLGVMIWVFTSLNAACASGGC